MTSAGTGRVIELERAAGGSREVATHRGGEPEDQERRAPVGDQGVLEQVCEQEVVGRERLERRVDRDRDEREAEGEDDRSSRPGAFAWLVP